MKEKNKGITLIALVVTIVVLLILAGVSIAMLTGNNGIITQSQNAKEITEQANVEEHVSVAIGSLITKFNGEINGITPKMLADQINEDENRSDVYAENETTFPTYIIFPKEGRKAEANLNSKNETTKNPMYETSVNESDIAPSDLFDYEIVNSTETGSSSDNLPTKTVKTTKIKQEYCNGIESAAENTNYNIIYNGKQISETLIIPYQVDGKFVQGGIEGELYRVVEVNLRAYGKDSYYSGYSWPYVETVVFPNTVKRIYGQGRDIDSSMSGYGGTKYLKNVVLPKSLETIGTDTFLGCSKLTNITIPQGTSKIEEGSFSVCKVETITIPKSVTNIDTSAFYECNVTNVNYEGTEEDWKKISIGSNNYDLTNVTINYNYQY